MTVVKPLGELSLITMGQSPSSTSYNTDGDGLPFFQGNADFGLETPIASTWCTEPKKIAEPGDLLVSVRAPIGAINVADSECCIGRGLVSIRPDTSVIDPDYLKQCLWANSKRLASLGTGSTFKAVGKSVLNSFEIPVYGLDEQKSIARQFSKVMILNRLTRKMLAKTDELVQSRFIEMFGSYGEETTRLLGEVAVVQTGATPSRANAAYYGGGIPWVKTGEINYTTIMQSAETISAAALRETNCKLFPAGTVLIAMYGQGDTRGRAGVLGIPAATNQACAAVLLDVEQCDNLFMLQQLRMKYDELRGLSLGGNQKNLSLGIIKAMPVVIPPIELQREFAAFVRQVESLKTDLNQQLDRLNTLYDSLTQRYFA